MNISTPASTIPLQKSFGSLKALPAPVAPVHVLTNRNLHPLKEIDREDTNHGKRVSWKKLAVAMTDETRFIPFEDIVYCMSTSNYTTIFIRGGTSYLCCKTLKDIEAKLPSDTFIRIHQSYLVNLHCITSLKKNTGELEIENKLLLPISRYKKTELYELFNL